MEVDLGFDTFITRDFGVWGVKAPMPISDTEASFDEAKKYAEWWLNRYKNQGMRVRTTKTTPGRQGTIVADIYYMSNGFEQRLSDVLIDKALVEPIRGNGFYAK